MVLKYVPIVVFVQSEICYFTIVSWRNQKIPIWIPCSLDAGFFSASFDIWVSDQCLEIKIRRRFIRSWKFVIDGFTRFPFAWWIEWGIDRYGEQSSPHCQENDQSEYLSEYSFIAPDDDRAEYDDEREKLMKFESVDGKLDYSCGFSKHEKSYSKQCYDGQCPKESMYPAFLIDDFLYDLYDGLLYDYRFRRQWFLFRWWWRSIGRNRFFDFGRSLKIFIFIQTFAQCLLYKIFRFSH